MPAPDLAPHLVDVDDLEFDVRNPRLEEVSDSPPKTQEEIVEALWKEFAVDEIALSIATNGYFEYEPLFAAREQGRLVVVEGNRRLAAVKLLRDPSLRKSVGATDLPRLGQKKIAALRQLPVVEADRAAIWQYVGFKHVNGPQPWRSFSKAQYVAWVHNKLGVPLDEIARQIGDRHSTVLRLYRALMVLEQAERADAFSRDDRYKNHFSFSHLYTGLNYSGIQSFLGVQTSRAPTRNPVPRARIENLGQLLRWLYGSESENVPPVVESQNPDLRLLDEALQSDQGIRALRRGLPLRLALDASHGDDELLREALLSARQYLQEARGKVLGYGGELDILDTAEDVLELANALVDEMRERQKQRPRASGRARSR